MKPFNALALMLALVLALMPASAQVNYGTSPFPNSKIKAGPANSFKGSLNGTTTSDLTIASCSAIYQFTQWVSGTGWQCGINPVLPSRAVAATLNLSAFSAVMTLGYQNPGDGGGSLFQKRASAVRAFNVTNNGTCGNGTWSPVQFNGGTGKGLQGTLVIAGGVVTSFTPTGVGSEGNGYTVNDVLTASTANIGGCGTPPQITVTQVGNAPFIDSFTGAVTTSSAGTGCTPGTYPGLMPTGGTGARLTGTVVIGAGGTLTSFSQSTAGGAYRVGQQLTFASGAVPGCSGIPVITMNSVTSPFASFSDAASNAWQYVPSPSYVSVLQFGAVADFNSGNDADATDNGPSFRQALQFASIGNGHADAASGFNGYTVFVPGGAYKICGGVVVYEYTTFRGAGWGTTQIKQCNSDNAAQNFVTLGDPSSQLGNFENKVWDMTLFGGFTSNNAYMVYSNNSQSGDSVSRVAMYGVSRGCVRYETGYGGQSMFGIHGDLCVINSANFTAGPSFDLSGNFGFVIDGQTMVVGGSASQPAVRFGDGGTNIIAGMHLEGGITNGISIHGSGSSPPQTTITALLGPATNLIYLETGTPSNNTTVINARSNGSTCTVFNQGTSTCLKTGNQLGLATY